jgi:hypothetical protein
VAASSDEAQHALKTQKDTGQSGPMTTLTVNKSSPVLE